ncbi:hypothetical protein GCM10017566_38310 [Amycolatopsis bartoniae]|uniref:Uncharacterized protein n=1 Tax=Amycolatopsis bartoniae TaxID=941986 RepID=A0A8H9MDB3_9PSEU|nr:hypothetical protein GCM10017566_38310 [Amycolatopsis bartoniae]
MSHAPENLLPSAAVLAGLQAGGRARQRWPLKRALGNLLPGGASLPSRRTTTASFDRGGLQRGAVLNRRWAAVIGSEHGGRRASVEQETSPLGGALLGGRRFGAGWGPVRRAPGKPLPGGVVRPMRETTTAGFDHGGRP